jgi:uncharacterized repeat protein (TIGR01451 family)
MQKNFRFTLVLLLLISIWANPFAPATQVVEAKPANQVATDVVISEFRTRGESATNSATDEFIEIYNPTNSAIVLTGYKLRRSSSCGSTPNDIYTFPALSLQAGQYYLVASQDYSGTITPDITLPTNMTIADSGGVAITDSSNNPIDQVGMCATTSFRETTFLTPLSGTANQSYERKLGGISDSCLDTNNNSADFQLINPSNPQNSSTISNICGVDLSIIQSVDNPTQSIGLNVDFTITVSNAAGLDDATNVTVQSLLPVGLTYVSDDGGGSYNNSTGIWSVGTLVNGTSETLKITATVTTSGSKINVAEVWSSDQFDIDSTPANSIAEDDYDFETVTPPGPAPTLSITNTVNNATPNIGSNVVFTINVSNTSGSNATGVVLNALFPSGLDYVSASNGSYDSFSRTLTWNAGTLANGSNTTLTVTAKVLSPSAMTLSANSSATGFSTSIANATVTPIISTQADLRLDQVWVRSTNASGTATLTITVINEDAVNAATNVQVRSLLPTGLTYVSHTSGQNYNSSTGIWAVGTILGGANSTLDITVRVSASGSSTSNFAEIWQVDQFDPDSTSANGDIGEDDSESVEVLVADLNLTQTVDIAGTNAVFTISVTNSGPDDANNIEVDNTQLHLPTSYGHLSNSATVGSYNSGTGIWTIPFLADGAIATLIVTTNIVSANENWAEINTVTEVDPDSLPNNSSRTEDDDAASPSADLSVSQIILTPNPYKNSEINSTVTFRITLTNSGYANATGVEVKDLLPAGLTYISHTSGQTYNKASGIWSVGTLVRNTSITLDITAKVTSFGIRTNWAEVWKSAQSDPDSDPGDSSTTSDDDASTTVTSYRSVIINEIAWSGTVASPEDEWIELYNPSNADITITGWKIRKNSCGASGTDYITLNGKISKGGYFLLERGNTITDNTTISNISANQIYLASSTPLLLDAGETLYLCDNFNNFIDTANQQGFGSSSNPWPQGSGSPKYLSMERKDTATETDSSWLSNNSVTKNGLSANGKTIYGTPGKKNSTLLSPTSTPKVIPTSTPAPQIPPRPIINEILARPGFDWNQDGKVDVFDEYIEIKNLTAIDIKLTGWKLDKANSTSFTIPDITLKPNERVVFYSLETNLLLSDGGETVRLINPSGKIYDAFTYTVAKVEDNSFCRLPDGNVYNGWFEDCTPTPTQSNTREGNIPTSPNGNNSSPVCELPDTTPTDFFFAECRAYGSSIWNPLYWEQIYKTFVPSNLSKWESYFE